MFSPFAIILKDSFAGMQANGMSVPGSTVTDGFTRRMRACQSAMSKLKSDAL